MLPPQAPMLARLTRDLPVAPGLVYEPKWDGFRSLVFRSGYDTVDLRSRHDRPLARYFPELVDAFRRLEAPEFALDGEIVVMGADGTLDFAALLARLHPATSRVERLRAETPARFIAFDLLAAGPDDLRDRPFAQRRRRLEELLAEAPAPILLTPATGDPEVAAGWLRFAGGGVDGVVAKAADLRYQPGKRAMVKVKAQRTADCVVAGFRLYGGVAEPVLSSLLLGLYDEGGALRHVGVVGAFAAAERARVLDHVVPEVTALEGHPWAGGFGVGPNPAGRLQGSAGRWTPDLPLDWVPLRPVLVAEVAYDQLEGDRFRHPARFRHWRPDRDPRSCTFEQFGDAEHVDAAALLAGDRL
ncbi:MAG: ATP-dependent DNA ligase [Actinomycetota bacterium]|nr:ATP-dependent DNA ligase [Actinomycetota bacterium]